MKKLLVVLISLAIILSSCTQGNNPVLTDNQYESSLSGEISSIIEKKYDLKQVIDYSSESYINGLGFVSLNDNNLLRYTEDVIYDELVNQLDNETFFVENIESVFVSKDYLDNLAYNSQENVYFGYKLSELDKVFQGQQYIFTLGDDGQTTVRAFEKYDDTFDKVVRNVAIGSGVILICVTVSIVTSGVGASAVAMVFAASAKSATTFALSSGLISGVAAGVVEGIQTKDFDKALKAAALKGSEGFKWGAFTGAITGGVSEVIALKGATLNGLTMNEAAVIQKESKYPIDVIKQFSSMEQYEVCKEAGLTAKVINGKTALIRNIDINYVDKATGLTNLERMKMGLAALDPNGNAYELHHIGQHADSTLAILTKEEHRLGDSYQIWHVLEGESEIDRAAFAKIREAFWQSLSKSFV